MTQTNTPAALATVTAWKGERQLVAAADVPAGVVLIGEFPIAFVETRAGEDEDGPWLLLEALLTSPAMFERVVAQDLKLTPWTLSPQDEARLGQLAQRYKRNPRKLAQLYHRVAANNIRYQQAGVIGYGIWPTLSRSNHSCEPNAQLHATPPHPLAELLIATRPVARGEAICWNYLGDDAFLALGWFERNRMLLRDFQFLCRCTRCERERPADAALASKAGAAAYFRSAPP